MKIVRMCGPKVAQIKLFHVPGTVDDQSNAKPSCKWPLKTFRGSSFSSRLGSGPFLLFFLSLFDLTLSVERFSTAFRWVFRSQIETLPSSDHAAANIVSWYWQLCRHYPKVKSWSEMSRHKEAKWGISTFIRLTQPKCEIDEAFIIGVFGDKPLTSSSSSLLLSLSDSSSFSRGLWVLRRFDNCVRMINSYKIQKKGNQSTLQQTFKTIIEFWFRFAAWVPQTM